MKVFKKIKYYYIFKPREKELLVSWAYLAYIKHCNHLECLINCSKLTEVPLVYEFSCAQDLY